MCGEYIVIVEIDDWVELDMFEIFYEKVKEFDVNIVKGSFVKYYDGKLFVFYNFWYVV